jgi:Nucleoside H+ symporter
MLRTTLALAFLMFVQYFGIGMFNIQLYTILSRPGSDGGLGLEAGQVATVAVLGSLASFPALLLVRRLERSRLARRHALALVLLLNGALAASMGAAVAIRVGSRWVWLIWSLTAGFSMVNTAAISLVIAAVLGLLPIHSRVLFYPVRAAGSVGYVAASWLIAYGFRPISSQPFFGAALAFGMMSLIAALFLPLSNQPESLVDDQTPPKGQMLSIVSRCAGLFLVVWLHNMLVRSFDIYVNPFLTDQAVPRAAAVQTRGVIVEALLLALAPVWFASRKSQSWFIVLGPAGWCIVFLSFQLTSGTSNPLYLQLGLPFVALNCAFLVSASMSVSRAETRSHATAQSVLAVIQGLGTVTGSFASGWLVVRYSGADGRVEWSSFWRIAAIFAFVVTLLAFWFRPRENADE